MEDNYATAGNITILQNNGSGSSFLLGGNGAGLGGNPGSGQTPQSGAQAGNTLSIYNSTARDMYKGNGIQALEARTMRWAGDPQTGVADNSYAYAMIDMTPLVRSSSDRLQYRGGETSAELCYNMDGERDQGAEAGNASQERRRLIRTMSSLMTTWSRERPTS